MSLILDSPQSYKDADNTRKKAICNGVGAEFFPKWLVKALNSKLFCYGVSLRECANIHDWMYFFGLTAEDKIKADKTFGDNMLRTIKYHSWLWKINPLYYLRRKRTLECYLAVKFGGHKAFWSNKK